MPEAARGRWLPGGLIIAAVVVVLDQLTKQAAVTWLTYHHPVPVLPSLNLTLAYNTGAAFSILHDAGGWQRWLLAAIGGVAAVVIGVWLRRLHAGERITALALALILGGAVGNLIDRVVQGYVVDFVDVYYGSWHWPAFNVADTAISIGAVLLVLTLLRSRRGEDAA